MKKDKKIIREHFNKALRSDKIKARDDLLKRMGCFEKKTENIPMFIENAVETIINPYLVAKFHSEFGFPKEMVFEEIERKENIKAKDYWSDWCDHWFNSFTKIPHTTLLDSEKYYNKTI